MTIAPSKDMDLASVTIEATASLDQDSRVEIATQWQAQVDMSHSHTPTSYKWSRPLSTGGATHRRMISQTSSRPSMQEVSNREGEVIFTFTAPPTTKQGEEVEIQVQCLNKSNRSRRFAIVTAQRRSSTVSVKPRFERRSNSNDTAAISATQQHDAAGENTVFTLTPDVRIGPLTSGACFETSLRYRTTSAGVLDFGTIRVIDLESRQTLDVAELPEVISLEQ